jgi:hypothetical protein
MRNDHPPSSRSGADFLYSIWALSHFRAENRVSENAPMMKQRRGCGSIVPEPAQLAWKQNP